MDRCQIQCCGIWKQSNQKYYPGICVFVSKINPYGQRLPSDRIKLEPKPFRDVCSKEWILDFFKIRDYKTADKLNEEMILIIGLANRNGRIFRYVLKTRIMNAIYANEGNKAAVINDKAENSKYHILEV